MTLTKKLCGALFSITLIFAAPMAIAQVESSDTVDTVVKDPVETNRSEAVELIKSNQAQRSQPQLQASWYGKKKALRGRDVVSFHKDSGPVKGSKDYVVEWDNTKWYFSNEENRDAFKTDPKKYIPEFGGFCPVALSKGKAKVGRTNQFTKVDDKLYLNYNKGHKRDFTSDPDEYILRAQVNW